MNTDPSVVQKWASCENALDFGYGGEDGYALGELGYNENYGCDRPEIVSSNNYDRVKLAGGEVVARLFGTGRPIDPEVTTALEKSCGECRYYRRK
ncbi:MAG: hypothetical protein AAB909_02190 [Patescibacteria group bacterium]